MHWLKPIKAGSEIRIYYRLNRIQNRKDGELYKTGVEEAGYG